MKRFWLVLLSLGLIVAFSTSAMAVDVKFSGSYYAAGMYLDKVSLVKGSTVDGDMSTSFFYQRLRVNTEFIVSPGLKLVTRFDALKRIWGGARSAPGTASEQSQNMSTREEEENIAFNLAYIEYASPIGLFQAGYLHDNGWGTSFANADEYGPPNGAVMYVLPIGPWVLGAYYYKEGEASYSAVTPNSYTDADNDKQGFFGIYNFKGGEVGALYSYSRIATYKPFGQMIYFHTLQPYTKVKIGPVAVEAEFWYSWGQINMENGIIGHDVQVEDIMGYVNAVVDLGVVYFGGTFAYMAGDDPGTSDKTEGSFVGGGMDWNPCLIMFNQDLTYWVGPINGYGGTSNYSANGGTGGMTNAWFGQGKVGVRPIAKLDINGSASYAQADKKPAGVLNSTYGWELDVTGTYKITNNLSYMLGVGYWFVGDYYKGNNNNNALSDDFMVINKLTLTF